MSPDTSLVTSIPTRLPSISVQTTSGGSAARMQACPSPSRPSESENEHALEATGVAILRRTTTSPSAKCGTERDMAKDRLYVERRPEGDYAVRKPNSERASDVLPTQAKAIERAR